MQKVILIGRLTNAPEAKTTPNGVSVTTFTVAVTRRLNREEADFINIVTWRGLADNCGKYLEKGQQVSIVGEIRSRTYTAQDGSKRYITEVHADEVEFGPKAGAQKQTAPAQKPAAQEDDDDLIDIGLDDEDLPF